MTRDRFGLQQVKGGLWYLVQPGGATNLLDPRLKYPHQTSPLLTSFCYHRFDLNHVEPLPQWVEDPLAQEFLPSLQYRPPVLLENYGREHDDLIRTLCSLSASPTKMLRTTYDNSLDLRFYATNITPMVFFINLLDEVLRVQRLLHLAGAHQRRLLLVANRPIPLFTVPKIRTELGDISGEPLSAIGAGVVREIMDGSEPVRSAPTG